ncbi:MAG: hypothetical protein ACU85V_04475 [Gammaproteobacteria bacterium]
MLTRFLAPLSLLLALTTIAPFAGAALVEDQRAFSASSGVSGGFTGTVAQSFQPGAENLAGVDVFLYSVARFIPDGGGAVDYTADTTLSVYSASGPEDFSYVANPPLTTAAFFLDTGTSREGWAEFRFDPVAVTPDTFYVLEFTTDNGAFGAASSDPYARGQALESGLGRDYFDLHFLTFSDDSFAVPLPAGIWLLAPALAAFLRRRSG